MSLSKNISLDMLSYEYDQLLIRDLGFNTKPWESMITKIVETLGVEPNLQDVTLMEATKNPGPFIVKALIGKWASERGNYWRELYWIKEYSVSGPYYDYTEYEICIKTLEEFLKELSGMTVYKNYHLIKSIFESQDYKVLKELNGTKITMKR